LERKIGQMLIIGFRGLEVDDSSSIVKDIKDGRVGGVILFDVDVALGYTERNIRNPEQVKTLIAALKKHANIPIFVSIDQEGGKVSRLKEKYGFPPTVSQQYIGQINNQDTTYFYANRTATTLQELGFNLNFAPVVDLNINPDNPVIGKLERSFSSSVEVVSQNAKWVIEAHHQKGIYCTMKHFPGHGSSSADSHLGFVDVTHTWKTEELIPYSDIVSANLVDCIMTAHIFNANLDPKYPATLSSLIITGILRNQLKYSGVVISDDLTMKAITDYFGFETAIEKAINAGVDILLFGNNLIYDENIASKVISTIKKLVDEGKITKSRIDESYKRIINLKNKMFHYV